MQTKFMPAYGDQVLLISLRNTYKKALEVNLILALSELTQTVAHFNGVKRHSRINTQVNQDPPKPDA